MKKKKTTRTLLIIIFALLIFSPLFVMPFVGSQLGRNFQRELSIVLGFIGLTMAGWQLAPVSRFTPAQKVFDMDRLYKVHHILSLLAVLFVTVHYLLLVFNLIALFDPEANFVNQWAVDLLNIFSAETPLRAKMGVSSLLAYILIGITSAWRKQMRLDYDFWRVLHDIFTVIIVAAGLAHILLVNNYSAAPAMQILLWVQTLLWILAALYIRVIKPIYQLRRPYEIVDVRYEAQGVYSLVLTARGFTIPDFHPGQVAWLTVRESPFSLRRYPFSIASSNKNTKRVEFAIKELGDFTATIKDLKKGETAYVDGPFGSYNITAPEIKGMVLIAGGIGIAPIMSILRSMKDANDTRPAYLFYGMQTPQDYAFRSELEQMNAQNPNFHLVAVMERPDANWQGATGFITREMLLNTLPDHYKDLHYFVCGPLPMISVMERYFKDLGIEKTHTEKFEMA
jgi:predicted ferric reductase